MRSQVRRRRWMVTVIPGLILLAAAVFPVFAASPVRAGQLAGFCLFWLIIGFAVVILEPRWIYAASAFVLGAVPFAVIPGVGQPVVLVLAIMVWGAVLTHPVAETRTSPVELAVGVLVLASLESLAATADGPAHYIQFIKWLVATSLVFALLRLDRRDLRMFGVVFSYAVGLGAAFALGMFFLDKAGTSMGYLSFLGYGRTGTIGTHLRFYVVENSTVVRLTGTYVDPNAAGIFLFVGLALALSMLRGWSRLIVAAVIGCALVVTLSRSAIFSGVVAVLIFVLFQRMATGKRLFVVAAAIVGAAAMLSVPAVYNRIFNSFSASDKGTNDRADALSNYLDAMTGHWWFGRGWGVPEFTDEVVGYNTNYVANSPLLTVYRGGIFAGIAFLLVLIAGVVVAHRHMRKQPWESGVVGAAFIGFVLVALQLDFPVVTHAPMTMTFSVLLVFLVANLTNRPDEPLLEAGDLRTRPPAVDASKTVRHG
jgi:polysaccharide biosynthesis protein PslJ